MKKAAAAFAASLAIAVPVAAEEHVTVPAPIGQKNPDKVVQPSGKLTEVGGWVLQKPVAPAPGAASRTGASGEADAIPPVGMPVSRAEAAGLAVVDASYLTVRGKVTGFEAGKSIAVLDAKGRTRTLALLKGASVYEGLKVGDAVAVRVPVEESGACHAADRVEKQTAATAAPSVLPSKFTQAQVRAPAAN